LDIGNIRSPGNQKEIHQPKPPVNNRAQKRLHCNGDKYGYAVLTLDVNWQVVTQVDGTVVTFTTADNKAFWDWIYTGYDPPPACDYTQNCHGFAFNVGDWPDTSTKILNVGPLLPPGHVPCYTQANVEDAEIASNPNHSIRVQSSGCVPSGPPSPTGPVYDYVITYSEEQFRESGTYTRSSQCPFTLDLSAQLSFWKANYDPALVVPSFPLYKK